MNVLGLGFETKSKSFPDGKIQRCATLAVSSIDKRTFACEETSISCTDDGGLPILAPGGIMVTAFVPLMVMALFHGS